MSKRMKVIFTISVALNVLLFGTIVGHVGHKYNQAPWQAAHLSEESQKKMKQSFKELAPLKRQIWSKKREMGALLLADNFDAAAYEKVVIEAADLKRQFELERSMAIKNTLVGLSVEERKVYVQHMSKRIDKYMKRHGKWGGKEKIRNRDKVK